MRDLALKEKAIDAGYDIHEDTGVEVFTAPPGSNKDTLFEDW